MCDPYGRVRAGPGGVWSRWRTAELLVRTEGQWYIVRGHSGLSGPHALSSLEVQGDAVALNDYRWLVGLGAAVAFALGVPVTMAPFRTSRSHPPTTVSTR